MPWLDLKRHLPSSSVILLAILAAVILGVGYHAYLARPCAQPVTYSIATFDPRFGISRTEFLSDAEEAAALWNNAAGHPLLVYSSSTADVPISLIYDTRQQLAQTNSSIDQQQAANEVEKTKIQALQAKYDSAQQAFLAAKQIFEKASADYAARVKQVNADGGADSATAAELDAERAKLQQEQSALSAQADALDQQGSAIQTRADALNSAISDSNAQARSYNSQADKDFNEGLYSRDSSGAHIDIYEFQNHTQLVRVLAHEFGHALGLGHDTGVESIMYPYNTGTTIALSAQDTAELNAACSASVADFHSLLPSWLKW